MASMFSKPKKPPAPPPPVAIVDPDKIRKAKERAMRAAQTRGGRQSTMLSEDSLG